MIEFKLLDRAMPEYGRVKDLYKSAFPKDERAPFPLLAHKAKMGRAEFLIAFDGDRFVGLAYMVCSDGFAYLFYLAVDKSLRAKGYGSAILSALKKRYSDKTLFLALEELDEAAPNINERKRRREFYEKNGFTGIPYKLKEASVIYDVMSIGGIVTPRDYDELIGRWSGRLLRKIIDMRIIDV